MKLAAGRHVGRQALLREQPVDRRAGKRLAGVDDFEALRARSERLHEAARAGAHVVLRVHIRGRAELGGQLDDVAAAHTETAALVETRAQRIHVRDRKRRHGAAIMKDRMRHPTPAAPELGTHDGLAYALFLPEKEPDVGVVILHGAGSAKESHFDFARGCRADGMAALAYDARGHGRSEGEFGPWAFDDALAMAELLRAHAPRVALRGSSMGAFQAIHAAAQARGESPLCAVVAICPAPEAGLLRFLQSGRRPEFECDAEACRPWLESLDIFEAARR